MPSNKPPVGVIAGAVSGGVLFLVLVVLLAVFVSRRHRRLPKGTFQLEEGEDDATDFVTVRSASHNPSFSQVHGAPMVSRMTSGHPSAARSPRTQRISVLTAKPPPLDQTIHRSLDLDRQHPFSAQPNVYGQRRRSSDLQIYHAEDFEVLAISR